MKVLGFITTILSYIPRLISVLKIVGQACEDLANFLEKFPNK